MKTEANEPWGAIGLLAKVADTLGRMDEHALRVYPQKHPHVTRAYQWEECWLGTLQDLQAEAEAVVNRWAGPKGKEPLEVSLAYRPWNDRSVRWSHQKDIKQWKGYYNGLEIGMVVAEPRVAEEGDEPTHSVRALDAPFKWRASSVEEGKAWVETMFHAWVRRAAEDYVTITRHEQAREVAAAILADYKGLKIGVEGMELATEQLGYRIERALHAALNGELVAEEDSNRREAGDE
jgi:hypothetical protein